jgi:hypothetical protein
MRMQIFMIFKLTQIFYHNHPNNLRNQRSKLPLYGQIFDSQAINLSLLNCV